MVRAAALAPLPRAPEIVLGILDLQGDIIPVIDLRSRFRLPRRPIRCDDHFVVARTPRLTLGLCVDATYEVAEVPSREIVEPESIVDGTGYLSGVTRTRDGLVLIHDLDALLFPAEEAELEMALAQA